MVYLRHTIGLLDLLADGVNCNLGEGHARTERSFITSNRITNCLAVAGEQTHRTTPATRTAPTRRPPVRRSTFAMCMYSIPLHVFMHMHQVGAPRQLRHPRDSPRWRRSPPARHRAIRINHANNRAHQPCPNRATDPAKSGPTPTVRNCRDDMLDRQNLRIYRPFRISIVHQLGPDEYSLVQSNRRIRQAPGFR